MKTVFIIEESLNWHAKFLASFLEKSMYETIGIVLISDIFQRNNTDYYFKQNLPYLTFKEKLFLRVRNNWLKTKDSIYKASSFENLTSVQNVINYFRIDSIAVTGTVNQSHSINWLIKKKPDVIISCGQAILGKEILKIPNVCCINRHSSLLPSYGGVLPVFHAIRNGEKFSGASIHIMEQKLDAGIVLAQEMVLINKNDTMFSVYKKTFDVSIPALLTALEKLENGNFSSVPVIRDKSYYTFPSKKDWKEFRKSKGVII